MPGPFADEELAAFVSRMPPYSPADVATMRDAIAKRAARRSRGPQMQEISEFRGGGSAGGELAGGGSVAVAGDSAGGTLAALACLVCARARTSGSLLMPRSVAKAR